MRKIEVAKAPTQQKSKLLYSRKEKEETGSNMKG
jgi:hypothetical protein